MKSFSLVQPWHFPTLPHAERLGCCSTPRFCVSPAICKNPRFHRMFCLLPFQKYPISSKAETRLLPWEQVHCRHLATGKREAAFNVASPGNEISKAGIDTTNPGIENKSPRLFFSTPELGENRSGQFIFSELAPLLSQPTLNDAEGLTFKNLQPIFF